MSFVSFVACHDCDLLSRLPEVPEGASVTCPRCGGLLRRRRRKSIERTLALTLAASVLFAVANAFPFLSFEMRGRITETTLATGVFDLWDQGVPAIALLVGFTAVLAIPMTLRPARRWQDNDPVLPVTARAHWIAVMKGAISKNAAYFSSHRMLRRYAIEAYLR